MMPQAAQEIRRCGIAPPATMTVAFNGEVLGFAWAPCVATKCWSSSLHETPALA